MSGGNVQSTSAARLGRLEAEVEGIQVSLDQIMRKLDGMGRTQWSPILTAAGLAVSLIGGLIVLGSAGPLRDISRHEAAIYDIRATRYSIHDADRAEAAMRRELRLMIEASLAGRDGR